MPQRRHQGDTRTYRELATYKERVQSFNMAAGKLVEYARVQIQVDTNARRGPARIVASRVRSLERVIDQLRALA